MKPSEKLEELWKSGIYGTGTLPPTLKLIGAFLDTNSSGAVIITQTSIILQTSHTVQTIDLGPPHVIKTDVVPPRYG